MDLWSLRSLGHVRLLRALATLAFSVRYRHGRIYVIPRGPLAGCRWRHHRSHQYWIPMGLYEPQTARSIQDALSPGAVLFDIGANAGYFALVGSRSVGAQGFVVAFEPVAENADAIRAQLALNHVTNVDVVSAAASDVSGQAEFVLERRNTNSHLREVAITHAASHPERIDIVETITVDEYVSKTGHRPSVIKIDVEGAEHKVLSGARQTLEQNHPLCVIATHSTELRQQCTRLLEYCGYRISSLPRSKHGIVATFEH
jgi:FkbM family methyltransferase